MYPIGWAIKLGISFYHIPLIVVDTQYTTVSGIDTRSIVETRTIQAAVDPSQSKSLERIFGGSIGDGDIGVYCDADTLFIDDAYDAGGTRKQSFVLYQGNYYRVMQDADWTPQADIRVYLAKRHVEQDRLFDSVDDSSTGENS
jgi:hypothetical protein